MSNVADYWVRSRNDEYELWRSLFNGGESVPRNLPIHPDCVGVDATIQVFDILEALLCQPLTHLGGSHAVVAHDHGFNFWVEQVMDMP